MSYTVGQRKGLGISNRVPLYVLGICPETNSVYVAEKESLFRRVFFAGNLHPMAWTKFPEKLTCSVKIRYRNPASRCSVAKIGGNLVKVTLHEPQWAPTPGQIAVFYSGDKVLGGSVIEKVE